MNKIKFEQLDDKEKQKQRAGIPRMILREFTNSVRKTGLSVDAFMKSIYEVHEDDEYYHQCIILRERMINLHKQITEHQTPEPVEQLPEDTLREFCDNNPIDPDMTPEECLQAIDAVRHGEALRTL